jgi:serine/threonine protein kinase
VDSTIGGGGMANVYSGTDDTGKRVAIKVPKVVGDGKDRVRLERIRVETQILKKLRHENIVRYLDEREERRTFYLVMEMIDGPTFMDKYRRKPVDDSIVEALARRLLEVLGHIHEQNIIHRDLNPKNIMFASSRRLVIIDWGAAKHGWVQAPSIVAHIGTPCWSAPEQFTTGLATPCSDLYGLGAVMFYLLTGEEPKLHMNSCGGLVSGPRDINRSVNQKLSNLVRTAMDPDPARRFQTASDMASMLVEDKLPTHSGPHIVIQGTIHDIEEEAEIGRTHSLCPSCRARGRSPEIEVDDPELYVSKHHARVSVDDQGRGWIEDLNSVNGTAISRDVGKSYRILVANRRERLLNNDVVAIVYREARGPYMMFTFKEA